MKEALILNWNAVVPKNGHTFILGDFAFHANVEMIENLLSRLHGQKTLILGNYDKCYTNDVLLSCGFCEIENYAELKIDGNRINLSHYPMLSWHGSNHGAWMLHGHCHGKIAPFIEQIKP